MASYDGQHLLGNLNPDLSAGGVFGICYSIIRWSGVTKGLKVLSPYSWKKTVGKLFEDGHATTFLIDLKKDSLTLSGIGNNGWEFTEKDLKSIHWARSSGNADTYVYYISVSEDLVKRYDDLRDDLVYGDAHSYALLSPNLGGSTRYENCVSSCHYLMYKLGRGSWLSTKGWWIPSTSNWIDWFKSFVPTYHDGYAWKYKVVRNVNTLNP